MTRVSRKVWALGAVGMLLVLGGVGVWVLFQAGLVERVYVYQDGSAQLRLAGSSTLRNVSWSMPREIAPGTENVGDVHWGSPALTVGAARGSRGDYQLNLREFSARGWTTPLELDPPLNSPQDDITPDLNADGDTIYFSSNRPGGLGGFDIYAARRGDNGWETPVNLGARINSPYDETGPAIHPSGAVLVFTTNRPRSFILSPPAEWSDVPRGQWRAGDDELAFVRRPLRRRAQQVGLARPRRAPQQDSGFRRRSSGERHQRRHRLGVGAGDKVVEGRRFWPREVENELLGHGQR